MSAHSITLHLPAPLYEHLKNKAKRARRSLEAELLRIVATAAPGEETVGEGARKDEVAGTPASRELSIEEAAAVLNVSHSYMVELLDDGEIPRQGAGDTCRVDIGDLLAYKQRDLIRRRRILAELTAEAQDMGLDY